MKSIQVGQTLGDYLVIGILGAGGMGKVFRVRNLVSERVEAMKVLLPGSDSDTESTERFLREIKLLARLQHPSIATLHSATRIDDRILMIMELVEGEALDSRVRRGPIEVGQASNYAKQALQALDYAHRMGVIHRDIKPSNMIVTADGAVKLVDFGIARGHGDVLLTQTGMAVGSAHYMSPEQALGETVDARTDVYSLGVTLYEMLTGARPFQGATTLALLKAQLEVIPRSPLEVCPGIPDGLSAVVMRALEKRRERRFNSAGTFATALLPWASTCSTEYPAHLDGPTEMLTGIGSSVTKQGTDVSGMVAERLAQDLGPIAYHLVKQASVSSRDVGELCRTVAGQLPGDAERRRFLADCEKGFRSTPTGLATVKTELLDAEALDRATKSLAVYIGPMARILVNRAAKKALTLHNLCDLLAEEIASPVDRAKFLATLKR